MIEDSLYKNFDGKELDIEGKKFKLEFDGDRRCFRLYQKKIGGIGMQNIDLEIQGHLEENLEENNYLEKINRPLPRHDYLLLDATTLQSFIKKQKVGGILPENLDEVVKKEKIEAAVIADENLDLKSVGRRVWIDKKNCFKSCIDNNRNIFIATEEDKKDAIIEFKSSQENVEAFKAYLLGEAHLRRQEKLRVPLFPGWIGRKFSKLEQSRTAQDKSSLEGSDDTMLAFTSAKLPHQAPALAQGLAIFPVFLLAIKSGIDNLHEELQETVDELEAVKKEIIECEEAIKHFYFATEITQEGASHCFKAMHKLQKSLKELSVAKNESLSQSVLGYPAMITMFSGVMAYQLQALLKFGDGVEGLTKGIGEVSFSGYNSAANMGALGLAGNSALFAGEAVMTVFILTKVIAQIREYRENKKEMKEIDESSEISALAKEIIISIKKNEQFYDLIKIISNSVLASGQATMAINGPLALGITGGLYAGLGLTILGITGAVSAEAIKETRHGFEKKTGAIEEKISHHYIEKLVKLVCDSASQEDSSSDTLGTVFSEVLRNQAFSNELFFHLASGGLAIHKILKEGDKDGDFEAAIKSTQSHYNNSYQKHLYHLVEAIAPNLAFSTEMHRAKQAGDFAYKLLHEKLIERLQIKEGDCDWIIELGEKLSAYEAHNDIDAIKEMSELEGLPTEIAETLDNLHRSMRLPSYQELISKIQIGFIRNRLDVDSVRHIVENIESKTEEQREVELRSILLESEIKDDFIIEMAQEKYIKENGLGNVGYSRAKGLKFRGEKSKGNYSKENTTSAISIIGKIRKSGGGIFSFSHKKNVYKIIPQNFSAVGKKVVNEALKIQKYAQRSLTYRLLGAVVEAGTMLGKTAKKFTKDIKEKHPSIAASYQQSGLPSPSIRATQSLEITGSAKKYFIGRD